MIVLIVTTLMASILIPTIVGGTEVKSYVTSDKAVDVELVSQPTGTNLTSLIILVFVNSTIYDDIKGSLDQYRQDLKNSGFEDAIILNWSEPNASRIRETLQQFYSNNSLAGTLLIGDLPAAEFEMFTEWDYERFPTDLYYMDLDGDWIDNDNDGVYDEHTGKMKVAPEIWVGRIKASNLGGNDEVSLINNYFNKNHGYRNDVPSLPRRALIYIDDDWVNFANMDENSLKLLYNETTVVTDKATTNADDYKERLRQGYEWVHLRSHGTWNRHQFTVPQGDGGIVYSTEYPEIDPNALFYQLFVCSAAKFTEPDYLAGSIVFKSSHGLLAIGSTKTGSMLMHWTFYDAIANGRTIGDAFKEWFIKWGEGQFGLSGAYTGRKWFYGLTIIGDPTLRLRWLGEKEIAELQKREEEVVNDLPLVINLRQQVDSLEENQSSLISNYGSLNDAHSALQTNYSSLETQLIEITNLLYFFLLTTTILLATTIYLKKTKPKSKD